MNRTTHRSKYFCGNEISAYGLEQGYLDYATLSKAFDAVLVNDITKLFYAEINGEYNEPEQENGQIDNTDEINDLNIKLSELMDENEDESKTAAIEELQDRINELEEQQDEQPEIFQYFIVPESGANIIKEYTDDPLYYLPVIDCYIWGVTHYGKLNFLRLTVSES